MTTVPTSEVLNRAADAIEVHGWGRGADSFMGKGGLCAMGAIFHAMTGRLASGADEDGAYPLVRQCAAGEAVVDYLTSADRWHGRCRDIWRWNDLIAAGGSEVVEVLRATALIEAAKEQAAHESEAAREQAGVVGA